MNLIIWNNLQDLSLSLHKLLLLHNSLSHVSLGIYIHIDTEGLHLLTLTTGL